MPDTNLISCRWSPSGRAWQGASNPRDRYDLPMVQVSPLRRALRDVGPLRSAYYLWQVVKQTATDEWSRPAVFDRIFLERPDPWSSTQPLERERVAITLAMLDVAAPSGFTRALEIGCAEGLFTEEVAKRCASVIAVDYSAVALDRARDRASAVRNAEFRKLDLRREALDGPFDLIFATGVLSCFNRPWDLRQACDKVIAALAPGGILMYSDPRQSRVFETAWWGKFALRGGVRIRDMLSRDPALVLESERDTEAHVFAVFRKR